MPVTTTTLTPTDVYNAFMAIVYTPATTTFPATYFAGNPHPAPGGTAFHNPGDYGPNTNPTFTAADIPDTQGMHGIIRAYYALHNMAMQLTRIREAILYRSNGSWTLVSNAGRTALKAGLEVYFPIPAGVPVPGSNVTLANLNAFLNQLYAEVALRRSNAGYSHIFAAQWCHGSCHGSRGRR